MLNKLIDYIIHRRLKKLSDQNILVSIAYGMPRTGNHFYSIDVLTKYGSFEKPFAARSLTHAIKIAEIECKKRGWIKNRVRPFPMQDGPDITWDVAEKIYERYAHWYGTSQSLERIAERGGFGWAEVYLIWKREYRKRT